MLKIGDKIKYVKANSLIGMPLGTVMTITDIKGVVVAVDANYAVGNCNAVIRGVMSYDEVEKYFEKVAEEKIEKKNTWTDWDIAPAISEITHCCEDDTVLCSACPYSYICDYEDAVEYKTNGKKIMARLKMNEDKHIKSYATCHKTDTFNLNTGLRVALARLNVKIAQERLKSVIEKIG